VNTVGLSSIEAQKRLKNEGNNVIAAKKFNPITCFIFNFINPLVIALFVIAIFSLIFGQKVSAIFIMVMALSSSFLSFSQELKARKNIEKLINLVKVQVKVFRDGILTNIDVDQIVTGDVIKLYAGSIVPADLQILETNHLFINQSALTGESIPVVKDASVKNTNSNFNSPNFAFMGSNVVSGNGLGLVLQTGQKTQFGQLSTKLQYQQTTNSFDTGIKKFVWLMINLIIVITLIIFTINAVFKHDIVEAFLFSLAVAVGLVPEMLPIMVNLNLSRGAIDMAKKQVIIKNLKSIQNFGAMDILCTDKTGTLTIDKITLIKSCNFLGKEDQQVLQMAYLNSFHQAGINNILDQAILESTNIKTTSQKIDELPYDNVRKILSVIVTESDKIQLISKGAPEEIIKRCSSYSLNRKIFKLNSSSREKLTKIYQDYSRDGLIVLGVAYKNYSKKPKDIEENDLVFKGFVAFLDPPKATAKKAILELESLGISLKILSGDNELIVQKICRYFDIPSEKILTGTDLDKLNDTQLAPQILQTSVFARLTPLQKERIVKILQLNHTVGFLGDGINDTPALKAADVGISVNNAVDIAKDTADIILLKKDLTVLKDCVLDGRKTFVNILKYIRMGASSNFGNMFSMIFASILLPFIPMLPIQIILNNFLYDFSQIAIPSDNVDPQLIAKPTPWNVKSIKKYIFTIGPISSLFDIITFLVLYFIFKTNPSTFQTGWFLESIITQTFIIHIIRTQKIPFIQSKPSKSLLLSSLTVITIGIIITMTTSFSHLLGFTPLSPLILITIAIISILYLITTQLLKNLTAFSP